jgi:hypothetical protein
MSKQAIMQGDTWEDIKSTDKCGTCGSHIVSVDHVIYSQITAACIDCGIRTTYSLDEFQKRFKFMGSTLNPGPVVPMKDWCITPSRKWDIDVLPSSKKESSEAKKCSCDMTTIMRTGCKCGGV